MRTAAYSLTLYALASRSSTAPLTARTLAVPASCGLPGRRLRCSHRALSPCALIVRSRRTLSSCALAVRSYRALLRHALTGRGRCVPCWLSPFVAQSLVTCTTAQLRAALARSRRRCCSSRLLPAPHALSAPLWLARCAALRLPRCSRNPSPGRSAVAVGVRPCGTAGRRCLASDCCRAHVCSGALACAPVWRFSADPRWVR